MEQNKTLYETVFIVNNTLGEEAVKSLVEKFTGLIAENGAIESVNEWGVRRFAYPIEDLTEGYYVLVKFTSAHDFPAELDRIYNITDGILRSLIIKCEQ
ncbi:MAG: 30S ribosomal protein S6 [Clostridia bacterium]|jgi:small subunit ribosomal protein S6|nr:30S ribosomal protein S6 [Oscillospiraceae bacterium]MBO5982155.1 30S ribosomal protein S6 [Clostridia bacterium]MBO7162679.1 30S ribosomal protein S6 [Clostridia bacterium]MBO7216642.1 30S ribosomal protein S6 [Clostridia bacterium]MBO7246495.1 30S ribosomal protein S6 [Clostridia bacterium]